MTYFHQLFRTIDGVLMNFPLFSHQDCRATLRQETTTTTSTTTIKEGQQQVARVVKLDFRRSKKPAIVLPYTRY